jgi:2-polyprenyl-3-methyl-5-hydroxy-6-metoxy-1,4-benzoquinol methylase
MPSGCPVCDQGGRLSDPVLARFPERTYRTCGRCGLVYLLRLTPPPLEYAADYFFDAYQQQYGKTYLEDFPAIKRTGRLRLRRIKRLLGDGNTVGGERRLLDVGCAYGPFLAAAKDEGFAPIGIDPAADAVEYVRRDLGIPAHHGFFPDRSHAELSGDQTFTAVTLWYVIEHLRDPAEALTEIHRLLRPGGVLAFSTPSFTGVSGRSPEAFLANSPEDHWTVWEPKRVRRILERFGFAVKKTVITGHHPERFPVIGKYLKRKANEVCRSPLYRLFSGVSRIIGWGDTFEAYAVKRAGIK